MPPTAAAAAMSERAVGSIFGRYNGPEFLFSIPFVANTQAQGPRNIPIVRPLDSLLLVWRGRVVIAVANVATLAAEAPQTIVQRIRVMGTHNRYGALIPIDLSGPTAFAWNRMFQERGAYEIINATLQAQPSIPFAQVGATFGNIATYDLEIHYHVPLGPSYPPSSRLATIPFSWFPEDWTDSIQVQVNFGDSTSFGTAGGGQTTTFTAFGSGAGSPELRVYGQYHMLGPLAQSIQGAVVIRTENTTVGGIYAAVAAQQRMLALAKQKTSNIVVKSGTMLAGTTAGVQVFATLADTILNRTQIIVDNKPIRNNTDNFAFKQFSSRQYNSVAPGGYLDFSFIDSMNPLTYFRGDRVPSGANLDLVTDIVTAGATQSVAIIQEQVYGSPRAKV